MPITSILNPGERVTSDDPRLFNVNDLAAVLGVKRAFISKLKRCGFKMPAGRATVSMAHEFLKTNPDLDDPLSPDRNRHGKSKSEEVAK